MLISNVHKSIIVMNSIDTSFSRNVFEAVQKLAARVLSGLKPDKTLWLFFLNITSNTVHVRALQLSTIGHLAEHDYFKVGAC